MVLVLLIFTSDKLLLIAFHSKKESLASFSIFTPSHWILGFEEKRKKLWLYQPILLGSGLPKVLINSLIYWRLEKYFWFAVTFLDSWDTHPFTTSDQISIFHILNCRVSSLLATGKEKHTFQRNQKQNAKRSVHNLRLNKNEENREWRFSLLSWFEKSFWKKYFIPMGSFRLSKGASDFHYLRFVPKDNCQNINIKWTWNSQFGCLYSVILGAHSIPFSMLYRFEKAFLFSSLFGFIFFLLYSILQMAESVGYSMDDNGLVINKSQKNLFYSMMGFCNLNGLGFTSPKTIWNQNAQRFATGIFPIGTLQGLFSRMVLLLGGILEYSV